MISTVTKASNLPPDCSNSFAKAYDIYHLDKRIDDVRILQSNSQPATMPAKRHRLSPGSTSAQLDSNIVRRRLYQTKGEVTMDAFDFAMKMELQGKAYYENIAASTELPGLKAVFTGLAADEQKHYDVIRELKAGKSWSMIDSTILEKAQNVFTDLLRNKENLPELHEDLDAYKLGMKIEADSVKLYEDMAKKEQDQETMQLYLRLANEEKKHYNILENVCDFVMRPKYFFKWSEATSSEDL